VCLILNRFTRSLTVMYASSACEMVFHVDPDDITGKPILLYIRADDLASFVEQVDVIKQSASILQIRFWFQSPNCHERYLVRLSSLEQMMVLWQLCEGASRLSGNTLLEAGSNMRLTVEHHHGRPSHFVGINHTVHHHARRCPLLHLRMVVMEFNQAPHLEIYREQR